LDFAKSDGSVINLKKNLEDLHDEYNWVRDYFREATFTLKPNQRETVKYVLQSYEKEMLNAIQTIEDRVIRAAANMLKANP
jgi:molecular chaperone GrpE (heat shock protein)